LHKLAHDDGIQHLRERPGNAHLFKKYLASGYVLFSALSEIGGHPDSYSSSSSIRIVRRGQSRWTSRGRRENAQRG